VRTNVTAEQATAAQKRAYDLGVPDVDDIKAKLAAGRFEELDLEYNELLAQYFENVDYGRRFEEAYDLFTPENNMQVEWLDAWIDATGSYVAYGARGSFRTTLGFRLRGTAWAKDTSDEQFDAMKQSHAAAFDDVMEALKKEPRCMPLYSYLISTAVASGIGYDPATVIDEALRVDPRNYQVREDYMHSLQPRWGGSYKKMAEFADRCLENVQANPRLLTLQGAAATDRAWYFRKDKKFNEAVALYTEALSYGDDVRALNGRAYCYRKMDQRKKALADYQRVLSYQHDEEEALKGIALVE